MLICSRMRIAVYLLCTAAAIFHGSARAGALNRPLDPVVLQGADLPGLIGLDPESIVAFRYQGTWIQIPLQVDELHVVTFEQVYNTSLGAPVSTLAYSDPGTYTGADPDSSFDADDELVFMAGDAGDPTQASPPLGTVAASGLELQIDDSLDGGVGYVYLFESDGSLSPGAGADYVAYDFYLVAGTYPADYDLTNGPNPEDSRVTTARYESHFTDRWIHDEMRITAGTASGVDILDRHRNLFAPGVCIRSEDTFSNGEGAFFANIDGPVRAIRSYMGANSGPLTQRRHLFYEGRQDIDTFLRVHAISGMMDLFDLSFAAIGMTYYDAYNVGGVTVDGSPDSTTPGFPLWSLLTGLQGSLVVAFSIETDLLITTTSYYEDDATPAYTQCTGDSEEYAQSGPWITSPIPNTDPLPGPAGFLTARRTVYYEEPGKSVPETQERYDQATTPLEVTVTPVPEPSRWLLLGAGVGCLVALYRVRVNR
jgi:hypothetical protein